MLLIFRVRIQPEKPGEKPLKVKGEEGEVDEQQVDIRLIDPRNPMSRAFRPVSASIPAKCS